ncbi:EIF3C [Mytilus coruscus]|uniref:EIF3C n=1 Tax=Mytilus coruscus TaxID=42192 RepID=A0A6J8CYH6_MYTCO|nr:EIF3C [Mytilus coruscus]
MKKIQDEENVQRCRDNVAHEFDARRRVISKNFHHILRLSERQAFPGPPEGIREHVVATSKAMTKGNWKECQNFIINDKMNAKASLDEPTRTVVMHPTEPIRLQSLALQLSEKVSSLVDNSEKIMEFKQGNFGFQKTNNKNTTRIMGDINRTKTLGKATSIKIKIIGLVVVSIRIKTLDKVISINRIKIIGQEAIEETKTDNKEHISYKSYKRLNKISVTLFWRNNLFLVCVTLHMLLTIV